MRLNLPKFYQTKLKNGLEVVAIPMNRGNNVVSVNIIYKVGSRNEVMGKTGLAHMLEHMNFKSTKNLKEGEFDLIVKSLGGVNNAFTTFDYTHYFINSNSIHLDKTLSLFAELMENLKLTDEEFQKERKVVFEERLWRTDNNPTGYLYFRLFNNSYIYHPYHWTPIGFKNDILNWSIEDIKNFHKTFYQPKNAIIVVSGDIEVEDVFNTAKKHFEKIKNRKLKIPEIYQTEPQWEGDKKIILNKEIATNDIVAITYQIPEANHKDITTLYAYADAISDGKSSILVKKLRYEKELVSQISAFPISNKDSGLFIIFAICNPNVKGEKVEKEIKKILNNIKITKSTLQKIQLNTKNDFINSLESSSGVAKLFADALAKDSLNRLLEYENNINNLKTDSFEEIKKYFKYSVTTILKKSE